jgi:hypothetical protein
MRKFRDERRSGGQRKFLGVDGPAEPRRIPWNQRRRPNQHRDRFQRTSCDQQATIAGCVWSVVCRFGLSLTCRRETSWRLRSSMAVRLRRSVPRRRVADLHGLWSAIRRAAVGSTRRLSQQHRRQATASDRGRGLAGIASGAPFASFARATPTLLAKLIVRFLTIAPPRPHATTASGRQRSSSTSPMMMPSGPRM